MLSAPDLFLARATRATALLAMALAVALLWSAPGQAQVEIIPLANVQFERSSNDATATGQTFRSDLLRLTAGFESEYLFARQEAFLDASYGTVSYDGLPDFGDDEYAVRGGLDWLLGRYFDGTLEALEQKRVPSISDSLIEGNSIEKEKRLTANVNAQLAERWRLETAAISRNLDTPIVEIADFGLRETINRAALRYLTNLNLSFGGGYEYIDGHFRNAPELATYTQRTPYGFLQYTDTGLHTLRARLGSTERKQSGEPEPFEEATGDISAERVLTGKTAVNLQGSRAIENYFGPDAGAFALVTRWNAGVNWQATGKSTVYADFGQTRTEFLGDGVGGDVVTGRIDRSSSINVSLENATLPWLSTELYVRFDDVTSNVERFSYDGFLVGIKFAARWLDEERPIVP